MIIDILSAEQKGKWFTLAKMICETESIHTHEDIYTFYYLLALIASGRVREAGKLIQLNLISNFSSSRFFLLYSSLFSYLNLTKMLPQYTVALVPYRPRKSSVQNILITILRTHNRVAFEQV